MTYFLNFFLFFNQPYNAFAVKDDL